MNVELNEKVAVAIGFYKREDNLWLNSWGASITELPDFSGNSLHAQIVVDRFEKTLGSRIDRSHYLFYKEYNENMSPEEICELALKVIDMISKK